MQLVDMSRLTWHQIRIQTSCQLAAVWQIVFLLICTCNPIGAHDDQHGADDSEQASTGAPAMGTGLILPTTEGPRPWSTKPALTDPNRFSIAIMTDRTGGHRPGIWMKAVERINWMRPDFVLSVGDLIEGYTEDETEIARQWNEFLGFIDQMDMKFFFVPGNHDVTNPKLHQIWKQQFGKEWYSFDYKGVHFVCLNSEDPSTHIGEEQLAWLEQDLQNNVAARWTLIFLHKPIWAVSEQNLLAGNPDSTNWTRVAALIGNRPHTIFAGHVHHYVQYERNGHQYYSLATTGGSSQLRGVPYGEFDQIAWLTMEADGPRVANLLLDGILPADIVTEQSIDRFRNFLQATKIVVDPILISDDEIQVGELQVGLHNDFDVPVTISATIEGLPLVGLSMETQQLTMRAVPGQGLKKLVRFEMKEPVLLERFRATSMRVKIASEEEVPLRAEWTIPVTIDKEFAVRQRSIAVDGNLDDWTEHWLKTESKPEISGALDQWTGVGDCSFEFSMCYDQESVYCAARVMDDQIVDGDRFTLVIDPRLQLTRLQASTLGRETMVVNVSAPKSKEWSNCQVTTAPGRAFGIIRALGRQTDFGYELEFALPKAGLIQQQGPDWSSFQAGVRVTDVDFQQDELLEILWRTGRDPRANRPLAHFIRR
ncbi:MAG: metallophosphoesterase [Planctomycetales bacterium]|nr:metallophosphoesterase [Planctomycetales bacterium]